MHTPLSRLFVSVSGVAAVALLAGCASSVKLTDPPPVETRTATPVGGGSASGTAGASSAGTAQSSVATVNLTQPGGSASAEQLARVVYFDFDSFVVKDEFRPVVEGNARALVANKQRHLVVEGHTDERGSREYNLALGQKRAEAVVRTLALLGVAATQVEAVSFGEERPAMQGSDEAAWAKNRRAELKDR
ncbi:peptidoglycan-associated lipoprotein Pal [Pseudorhodoferax sp.]|uniref:peptidoglycan-associated lipoprotein Pal n=1 Tax=Pseudorhodoferax sp. TaxID=1993553 RepID=UPI002DD63B3A|nr:peptidoglycan-associated lipoprotein Pal [Pseudorhodoferax sp.]